MHAHAIQPRGAQVRIERVETDAQLEQLLSLPERLYASDPAWVQPLRAWVRRRLSPRNAFFREADLELYLARRGSEPLGSISVLRDRRHERVKRERVAFFGFFETIEDGSVAEALLDTAMERASAWGAQAVRGPRNLTRVEEVGLTVEGHDRPAPLLAGHHPSFYAGLVEAAGFRKHHDVLAYDTPVHDASGRPRELPVRLAEKAAAVAIPGLEVRPVRWSSLRGDLGLAHEVFVDAFRDVPDNTPMPKAQFTSLAAAVLGATDRRLMQLAIVDGEPAGFAICVPELNEAIARARGRLFPGGWARLLLGARRIRTASFKLLGVMPGYRSTGLHALLIRQAIEGVRQAGYARLEASLVDERNGPMRHVVESAGMQVYKRYRIYERAL